MRPSSRPRGVGPCQTFMRAGPLTHRCRRTGASSATGPGDRHREGLPGFGSAQHLAAVIAEFSL